MYARGIEGEWHDSGYPAPTVVSISLGPIWLLNPERADEVIKHVIPTIESRLGIAPRHRYLIGESMGGFNAIQLLMRHPSTFKKVAVLCPGVMRLSPSATRADVTAFVARTGANRRRVEMAVDMWKSGFPTEGMWKEASPLIAGERLLGPQSPPLYVSCGTKDEFGFFEGAKAFAELAQAKGVPTAWEAVVGGHCSVAPRAVAQFFSKNDIERGSSN
jgi:enterochelin esterase-like enzyme